MKVLFFAFVVLAGSLGFAQMPMEKDEVDPAPESHMGHGEFTYECKDGIHLVKEHDNISGEMYEVHYPDNHVDMNVPGWEGHEILADLKKRCNLKNYVFVAPEDKPTPLKPEPSQSLAADQ